jgi:hypothetical protein
MFCLPSFAFWKSLELLEERMPFTYYGVSRVSSMFLCSAEPRPSGLKKLKYNPLCDVNEECSSDMLSEEFNIDSDDEINMEIEGETASEESSNETSESGSKSETVLLHGKT